MPNLVHWTDNGAHELGWVLLDSNGVPIQKANAKLIRVFYAVMPLYSKPGAQPVWVDRERLGEYRGVKGTQWQ